MNKPDIFALGGRDDTRAQLRRACEALAAGYRAPLPEGDAGLIAAIERWRTLKLRHHFEINYTLEDEEAVIEPISTAAEIEFENMIEAWPVQGLAGAAAKLRYMLESDLVDIEDIGGEQLIEIIERQIGSATL